MQGQAETFWLAVALVVVNAIRYYIRLRRGKPRFAADDWFINGCVFWLFLIVVTWTSHNPRYAFSLGGRSFVIAGAYLCVCIAVFFCLLTIVYHRYPRIAGKPLQNTPGKIHFWVSFWGSLLLVLPAWNLPDDFRGWAVLLLLMAQVLFVVNLIYSAAKSKKSAV